MFSKKTWVAFFVLLVGVSALLVRVLSNPVHAQSSERIVYTKEGLIEEAFVTFATENYFKSTEVLLDSIKAFSSRPVVVVGVNADVPFSSEKYPFLIKKRIDVQPLTRAQICLAKSKAILESGVKRGIFVDADLLINKGFDVLFEHCKRDLSYPLSPIHPQDVSDQQPVMAVMGVAEKSMPYVQDCVIVFSPSCMPLIEEWNTCNIQHGHLAACYDETTLNVILWKHGVTESLKMCSPYYPLAYDYLSGKTEQHIPHGYEDWIGKIDFCAFHGCKSGAEGRSILKKLIERARTNHSQTNL